MPRTRPDCQFRSILCAIDFSAHSAAALRHAAALAGASNATLTALFVVDPLLSAAAATAYDEHALERRSRQELRRFVSKSLGPRRSGGVQYLTVVGRPGREILSAASRVRADLIALGTQGLTGVSKVFFGSTTDQVLRRSSVPVLAIPVTGSVPGRSWPRRLVAVALALDASAAHDMTAIGCLAMAFRARLLVVHPVPATRIPSWVGADSRAYTGARVQEARRQLDELCGALGDDLSAECRVVVGDPADTIAALAAKERADLLILTLRKSPGLLRGRTRGTAYRILCAAGRPVLAWPAQASNRLRRRR